MKRVLQHHALIATLVTMLLLLAGFSALAQTSYDLTIAGVRVTSANCKDLSVIDGVTGKVSYDPESHTLYLEDATIELTGSSRTGIFPSAELTCDVKGDVYITSSNGSAILSDYNTTIKGDGKLTLKSYHNCGILVSKNLIIEDCTVSSEGSSGITGRTSSFGNLTIKNASVTAKGTYGSIYRLASFTLEGCEITKPAGAVWNAEKHGVCDAEANVITDEVVIAPPIQKYDLEIAGVEVTSANCSDLSIIDGVNGKVSYDPDTKTLTLQDATIESVGGGIKADKELACIVKGEVSVVGIEDPALSFADNAIIKGDGKLNAESFESFGIYSKKELTIDGCTISTNGKWGIAGDESYQGPLTIHKAYVTAKGEKGSICNLASLKLDWCEITKPAGASWNATKHAVCDAAGNIIKDEVVITPVEKYNLVIAGEYVTSAICSDLTVIEGVTGKVSYDPDTHTLTLEDATIEVVSEEGIWTKDIELTCVVKGKVSITSSNSSAMCFFNNAIIQGDGQLTINAPQDCAIYIDKTLVIDGCTVDAEGRLGLTGNEGKSGESLTIRNASVTAKGTKRSICNLASLKLEGCEITKPAGAVWMADKKAVCDAEGEIITDEVVITPKEEGGTAIDFVTPEQLPSDGAIYDMNGVLRSETLEELPTGVYIVGGQKVMHVQR
ncbi:MAG: hypothetical protein JNG44_02415 [Porphyromonas sp.]|uniref:hypothetical protein n=1 Tax=Porphyromonas sp. TaxID=1924944 RepID=UPI001A4DB1F2|nr:hypothetical protein [Porphyromonas sp.]MBL6452543.1 hypothetical protein [Porphyromonas sp.]